MQNKMSGDYRKNLEQLAILFDTNATIGIVLLQIKSLEMFWQSHTPSELAKDFFLQRSSRFRLAMHNEDALRGVFEIPQPAQDFRVIRVRGKLAQHFDFCSHIHHLPMNLQLPCAFEQ
jgi:hypothetical protein